MNKRKLNFITIDDKGYSRSWNYYSGAKKLGENVEFFKINHKHHGGISIGQPFST
jgi:hypothetical protein